MVNHANNISKSKQERIRCPIQEYANACGETVSNLIRKVVIGEAIFIHLTHDSKEYGCNISIPDNISGDEETKIVQGTYNKIRQILNLNDILI